MKLRSKLLVNSAIVLVCMISVGLTGYSFINRVANVSLAIVNEQNPAIQALSQVEQSAWEVMALINAHISSTDPEFMKAIEQEIAQFAESVKYQAASHGQSEKVISHSVEQIKVFETEWDSFIEAAGRITEASREYAKDHALEIMSDKGKKTFDRLLGLIRSMSQDHYQKAFKLRDEAVIIRKQSGAILIILLCTAIVVSIASCGFITRSITLPIIRIIEKLSDNSKKTRQSSDQTFKSGKFLAEISVRQASAIEETSSSVEQMSSMTRKNADNAKEAERIVKEVREIAMSVGNSMTRMIVSMKEISETGKQTQGIVKTIDEIAFQTNLLALNAAVEAARAGNYGSGFSVVANEVRNLALRATEAAKSTNSLIDVVLKKINDGEIVTKSTSADFSHVTEIAGKACDLVAEIASASFEQAQGIEQINVAMTDMEQMTQTSAANSEQTASIAEDMFRQSKQIDELVNQLSAVIRGE